MFIQFVAEQLLCQHSFFFPPPLFILQNSLFSVSCLLESQAWNWGGPGHAHSSHHNETLQLLVNQWETFTPAVTEWHNRSCEHHKGAYLQMQETQSNIYSSFGFVLVSTNSWETRLMLALPHSPASVTCSLYLSVLSIPPFHHHHRPLESQPWRTWCLYRPRRWLARGTQTLISCSACWCVNPNLVWMGWTGWCQPQIFHNLVTISGCILALPAGVWCSGAGNKTAGIFCGL